ncbi:MAG: SDR family oxidoreductase [Gemmatimonadaceae bacterium]
MLTTPSTPIAPVALVTGATSGIGASFARQLGRWGYDLVLVARDEDRLRTQSAALSREFGIQAMVLAADLATDDGVDRVAMFLSGSDPIDVLINNAGIGTRGSFANSDARGQETMIRLHVLAVSRLTKAVLPGMIARGRGAVITVSSVASYLTSSANVNYCATKAYQRVAMESLAKEVIGSGVYVQALCPGFTRTEFHERASLSVTHLPNWMWTSADDVVAASLSAMRASRPIVVVPGWHNRIAVFIARHFPTVLTFRYRTQGPQHGAPDRR